MNSKHLLIALTMVSLFASLANADNGRGKHQKIYIVPTPGKVVIDGKLDDWDLSGQLEMYVMKETSETQGAKFAMMYDKDALYISGIVRDTTPMMNRHDPKVDPGRAWDADECQIYLCTDPSMGYPVMKTNVLGNVPCLMDMYLWYYTDRKEACLAMYQALAWTPLRPDWDPRGNVPSDKFQGAYVKAADGRGYTFEYRIPWSTLGFKRPMKAGELTAGLVEFCWGDAMGMATLGDSAWAYDVMNRAGFPFQESGCWGKFILSDKGHLPKEMVEEGLPPEKPLPLTYDFDLPEDSNVSIQFFDKNNNIVRTLIADGARHGGHNIERWDGLDYSGKPMAAGTYTWKGLYHQPIKTKFLFSAHNSGQPPYHTDDGTGSWGGDHGTATTVCALSDGVILGWNVSEAGFGIIKTDLNGKKIWGTKHNATDIASDGKHLFVAGDVGYDGANSVKVFDPNDCRPLSWGNGKLTLDPPPNGKDADNVATAVAYGNGKVYVSWTGRNTVGVYDAISGKSEADWSVGAPGRLAVRPDGSVAVLSGGKVIAVDNKGQTSVLIADHLDLATNTAGSISEVPNGIAVGPDGTIYVANNGKLQNVSVFDANGKYLRSIGKEGGRPAVGRFDKNGIYEPGGMTLDKNGHLWVAETFNYPKRISEWDAKTGALVNEFFGAAGYFGWAYMDPRHSDELYCSNTIWKVDWKNNTCSAYSTIWRPTAPNMIGNVSPDGYNGALRVASMKDGRQFAYGIGSFQYIYSIRDGDIFKPVADRIVLARTGMYTIGPQYDILKDAKKYPDGVYYWVDKNNDQIIQADELSTSDSDYNRVTERFWNNVTDKDELAGREIGLPNANLARYDGTGGDRKVRWMYQGGVDWPNAMNLAPIRAGNMNGLTMPLGVAGDFTGAASYFGVFNIVTAEDGLYVMQGFRDARLGGGLGPDVLCSETIIGQLVRPDGLNGRYFFLGGAADGRVTEILGLDTVKRLPGGVFTFTEADAKTAADAQAAYETKLAKSQHLSIVRGLGALPNARPVGKTVNQFSFEARAAYDAQNLYVAYNVISPSELANTASDPHLIFKGGNLIDIQIGTDPQAKPHRKTPAPGDIRLLVTRQDGKPVAVLFRPKVKGFSGKPIVLTSPTGTESFDNIEGVDIALNYQKTATGFTAMVTVPLKLLDWEPNPGEQVKMDLGYIFGNVNGNHVALRAYWSNNGFSAGVINDVPNESRLEPAEWSTVTVE